MEERKIEPGQRVTVRLAGGVEQGARAIRQTESTVYVTSERLYQEASNQGIAAEPLVGIPIRDVWLT
jgi:hypothetical protein